MNISIKNKFSVIIVFMSILSLLFAYVISNEFISKNLSDREILREKEKIVLVEREIRSIENLKLPKSWVPSKRLGFSPVADR